jgi:type I restriction enzyme, R subunit
MLPVIAAEPATKVASLKGHKFTNLKRPLRRASIRKTAFTVACAPPTTDPLARRAGVGAGGADPDQAEMYRALNPAVDRFKKLDEEKQEESRNTLSGYVRLYSFLSQVMPFADEDLECLYTFGRFLELKLPKDGKKAPLDLDGDVALAFYRIDKLAEQRIMLSLAEVVPLRGPTDVGTREAKDPEVALSEIIDVLNERFGTEFKKDDQLALRPVHAVGKAGCGGGRARAREHAGEFRAGTQAQARRHHDGPHGRQSGDREPVPDDPALQTVAFKAMAKQIYDEVRKASSRPPPPSA